MIYMEAVMVIIVLIVCFTIIIQDIIREKRRKNKTEKPVSDNQDWRKLPASEVFGDISAMKKTSKEWHDKPLTF